MWYIWDRSNAQRCIQSLVVKPEGQPLGRQACIWDNNIKVDLIQDRDKWKADVNTVMGFWGSVKCGPFLD